MINSCKPLKAYTINRVEEYEVGLDKLLMKTKQDGIFLSEPGKGSGDLVKYFITGFFLIGLLLAHYYDTWDASIYIGGTLLIIYYTAQLSFPGTILYKYIIAIIPGIFMIQFVYQVHGSPEMYFLAFIASGILVIYKNPKLRFLLAFIIALSQLLFFYLQREGTGNAFFAGSATITHDQLSMIAFLFIVFFLLCALWVYNFRRSAERRLKQSFETGISQEGQKQQKALIVMGENLKVSNRQLKEKAKELEDIFNTIDEVLFSVDLLNNRLVQISPACEKIYGYPSSYFMTYVNLWQSVIHPGDKKRVAEDDKLLYAGKTVINQYRIIRKDKTIRWVEAKIIPSFNRDGKLVRKDGIIKDISDRKLAEEVLKENSNKRMVSERLMKSAEKLARFGSWQLDVEKKLVSWSDGAFYLYGYKPNELEASYELFLQHIHPEDLEKVKSILEYAWEHLNFQKLNFRVLDRYGKLKYIQAELQIDRDINGMPVTVTGFKQDITEKVLLEMDLAAERLHKQKEITDAVITAQEQERLFLGEELHDNINPILATVKLYMDCAITDDNRRINLIDDAKQFVSAAMNEIRSLSKSVLPPSLGEVGLVNSLNDLIENIEHVNELQFDTQWNNIHENELNEKLKLTIYRIIQEQINNILKHADAGQVSISLKQHGEKLNLSIKDNGIGFDTSVKRHGVGLQNIISRADLFDGKVKINSQPGAGCELLVDFINKDVVIN